MWLMSTLMGMLQGITEYLPVSSTGHLILLKQWLAFPVDDSFEVFIQAGSVLAVLLEYRRRFSRLFHWNDRAGFSGRRGWLLLGLTTLPALCVGLVLHDRITEVLYGARPVALALGIGGVVMLLVEWRLPAREEAGGVDSISWRQALGVGLCQCLALFPGVSRSASTIIGGRLAGLDRKTATEYSFYAAVPVLLLASAYVMVKAVCRGAVGWEDVPVYAMGFGVSFVFSLLAIRLLIRFVSRHTLAIFGWYRIVLGLLILWIVL